MADNSRLVGHGTVRWGDVATLRRLFPTGLTQRFNADCWISVGCVPCSGSNRCQPRANRRGEPMDRRRRRAPKHSLGRVGPRVSTYSLDASDGFISPTPEPARHGWFRPMKREREEFTMETEKAVRPNPPSLPELMGALRRGGSQVSLEKRPDLGYVVVRDGRVVAAARMQIHLCIDLRDWMVSNGLWP